MSSRRSSEQTPIGVSVIGLGKLGACIAAIFAHKGFSVVGADTSAATVQAINEALPPVRGSLAFAKCWRR